MSDTSDKISYPGEINVTTLKIISSTGVHIDVSAMVGDITIYEDIFSNTMSGHIILQDSLDLISTLPLIGQEQLILELQTPTLTQKFSKTFYIYKLQNRTIWQSPENLSRWTRRKSGLPISTRKNCSRWSSYVH